MEINNIYGNDMGGRSLYGVCYDEDRNAEIILLNSFGDVITTCNNEKVAKIVKRLKKK